MFSREVGQVEWRYALSTRGGDTSYVATLTVTLQPVDEKRKLALIDEKGVISEYFLIPIKGQNRRLMIEAEKEPKEQKVWNPKTHKEEKLWE